MTRPDISIVIPVYNAGKYLERCLDSILNRQNVENIEIVAVNDASSDDSAEVLARLSQADPRINVINKVQNEGSMMARHTGYNVARGRYFAFVDADDYLPDGSLRKLLDRAEETGADIVIGDFNLIKPDGTKTLLNRRDYLTEDSDSFVRSILADRGCSMCGAVFKRRLFDEIEYPAILHQRYADDRIVMTVMMVKGRPKINTIDIPAYCYVVNYQSMTRGKLDFEKQRAVLTGLYYSYNLLNGLTDRFRKENDAFLSRYLSLYIERRHPVEEVPGFNEDIAGLLTFSSMRKNVGLVRAVHTKICEWLPLYGKICAIARNKLRRLRGR